MAKRKLVTMQLTVSVPVWMNASAARREARSLINNQTNYTDFIVDRNGDWKMIDEETVRVRKIA